MAQLPRQLIDNYTSMVNSVSASASAQLEAMLETVDFTDIASAREQIIEAFETVVGEHADMMADVSAEFYEVARELQIGRASADYAAYSDYVVNAEANAASIRAFMEKAVEGDVAATKMLALQRMDYVMKRAAAENVLSMGRHDTRSARFARVPSGLETCSFCLMLASRGFVYRSQDTAGLDHYHANCDCRIVPGFSVGTTVDGYDPDEYYQMWAHPEKYPELQEQRNARRRELYAEKKAAQAEPTEQ